MIGIVIVTHGRLAVELLSAVQHIVGPQTHVKTVCIGPNDDIEERRNDIAAAIKAVDPSAQVRGCSSIGAGCRVGACAIVEDSILWPGAQIASRSRLNGCIVRTRKRVEGLHRNADI
jgi:PTS system mannose-specific IIA component